MDGTTPYASAQPAAGDDLYRKIAWRIIPFLFVAYVVSYIDRINISFAQLQMKHDLGFSDAVYGLGAGIFFIGYVLFEVPGNFLLHRIGARLTFCRIMFCWGVVATGMLFVTSPWQFYTLRFLLGVFEAGFFPGIVLYLTYWFPSKRRATMISWFFAGVAIAGLTGSLLSGAIMKGMANVAGMYGWQWMFLLQGLPAIALGVVAYFYLDNRPHEARWLSAGEKDALAQALAEDAHAAHGGAPIHSFVAALKGAKVYLFSLIYFGLAYGSFTINFWVPTLIKQAGVGDILSIGLYSAVPYGIGAIGIVLVARRSDAHEERRWHFAVCALVGAASLSLLTLASGHLYLTLAMLAVAVTAVHAAIPVFWPVPTARLTNTASAGCIALISSIGQLGGFTSPYLMGLIKTQTGRLDNGLYLTSAILCVGVIVWFALTARNAVEKPLPASSY